MRLAYVTAHYPPDFTSGATLQVERLAHRAAALGHDVEVFAGAISRGLDDGAVATDDVGGVAVHWIGTADRVEQGIDGNWDNPSAASEAARWLRRFQPDVVHVHTLQTLGVGVVDAALALGCRVIVTMHDMWWWCPRLFLIDRSMQPCSMVTDAGSCACSGTTDWRRDRARRLRGTLAQVDEILTPSSSLRDLVVANGVAPDRVHVDANDVAIDLMPRETPTADSGPVRFLYVGGDSDLKGAGVLCRAAHRLAARPGWELSAHGLSEQRSLPPAAHGLPMFEPERLAAVLADHDVMIIPSIARESFSIAAREGLIAGLPVITSDCLGPEEVIVDGENGLVVPTADDAALAAAMASLIDDSPRLERLRAGVAANPPRLLSTAEHVDFLIDRYVAAPVARERRTWNVAFVVGADGAIARYRVHHPRQALELHGASTRVVHYLDPALDRVGDDMDAVVLQRVPATSELISLIRQWRERGLLVVFDVDDFIVDPTRIGDIPGIDRLSASDRDHYLDGLHRYRTTLEHCDGVIVPTVGLARSISRVSDVPTAVVANGIGLVELDLAAAALDNRTESGVRLAYFSGSDSHQADLDLIADPVAAVLRARPEVQLLIVGGLTPSAAFSDMADRVHQRGFQPWDQLYRQLAAVDVNLAPLVLPSEFNEAKSAIKWLEAAAVGVVTAASPSGPFHDAIDHERTGVLCATPDEWCEQLVALVDDPVRRRRLGRRARRQVEMAHGPHVTAHAYLAALDDLMDRRAERRSDWPDRAPDERAPSAPALAPYRLGDGARVGGWRSWLRRRR